MLRIPPPRRRAGPASGPVRQPPTEARRAVPRTSLVLRVAIVALTAVAALAGSGASQVAAQASEPVTGFVLRQSQTGFSSLNTARDVTAVCPAGTVVLGGGALIVPEVIDQNRVNVMRKVTVTQMEPFRQGNGGYAFAVTAAEIAGGTTSRWRLVAQAYCGHAPDNYEIVHTQTTPSFADVQVAPPPECPGDTRVLGTGGRVNWPLDIDLPGVGLQVQRVDALGGIARVQAHEQVGGVSYQWSLMGFVVCGDAPRGYEIRTGESPARASETEKVASVACTGSRRVLGAGGAVTNIAPGNITLNQASVQSDSRAASAAAYENTLTNENWDFIVVRTICADVESG